MVTQYTLQRMRTLTAKCNSITDKISNLIDYIELVGYTETLGEELRELYRQLNRVEDELSGIPI